jgi:hypothetical protein
VIYSFSGLQDGDEPNGSLVFDSSGNLYGLTAAGGVGFGGTAFQLSPQPDGSWRKSTIFNFGGPRGAGPCCRLIFDSGGNLYGTTQGGSLGAGVVYQLVPSVSGLWNEHVLHTFVGGQDGLVPTGNLVMDDSGNLYGATVQGGSGGEGTIFEIQRVSRNSWKERILHSFSIAGGGQGPNGSLVLDSVGDLYGLTYTGGRPGCVRGGCGIAFELSPHMGSWSEKVLTDFSANIDGGFPVGGLTRDAAGNLYGVTDSGSGTVAYYGTVFEITP